MKRSLSPLFRPALLAYATSFVCVGAPPDAKEISEREFNDLVHHAREYNHDAILKLGILHRPDVLQILRDIRASIPPGEVLPDDLGQEYLILALARQGDETAMSGFLDQLGDSQHCDKQYFAIKRNAGYVSGRAVIAKLISLLDQTRACMPYDAVWPSAAIAAMEKLSYIVLTPPTKKGETLDLSAVPAWVQWANDNGYASSVPESLRKQRSKAE